MHNLLRTLPPEKKKKWPVYLPELTYVYNVTPHSSTGYTPFFLFMGFKPRLPIDSILRITDTDDETFHQNLDEWVKSRFDQLQTACSIAQNRMKQKAAVRKARHDEKIVPASDLKPGDQVLVRNRPLGRNKCQDKFLPEPYVIVNRISPDNSVYSIQLADGRGQLKCVNRDDLKPIFDDFNRSSSASDDSSDAASAIESDDDAVNLRRSARLQAKRDASSSRIFVKCKYMYKKSCNHV